MSTRFPRLDGLRAVAVVGVMVYHWHHPEVGGRTAPLGFLGVQLFFVLSGFLIGGILIRGEARNAAAGESQLFTLRQFVVRRAIRIFPAFFVFIAITALVLGAPDPDWWWYPLYLGNFRIGAYQRWPGFWSHTWTLAVEEQFYLFAPLLVLFAGRARTARVVPIVTVATAGLILLASPTVAMRLAPPQAFYGLLVGLCLALVVEHRRMPAGVTVITIGAVASAISLCAFVLDVRSGRLLSVAAPVAFAAIVWWATTDSRWGAFLASRPALHVGGLAYGLYLWHLPARELWDAMRLPPLDNDWKAFVPLSLFTCASARLSWELVEQPVNALKLRVPYHRDTPPEDRTAAVGSLTRR